MEDLIKIGRLVHRQTPESRFSHYTGSQEDLCKLVARHWEQRTPGYRSGVVIVPVPPIGFMSPCVPKVPGMALKATFESRIPGEAPRLHIGADPIHTPKTPAVAVNVVLYASEVLAEDDANCHSFGCWEIISINARVSEGEEPLQPEALIANHLQESGGTATQMTDSEFVAALRVSRAYWAKWILLG